MRKCLGKIYDGRWKAVKFIPYESKSKSGRYLMKNIYNDIEFTIREETLLKVDKGESTLSKVICHKIQIGQGWKK